MSESSKITVELGNRSYDILIEPNCLESLANQPALEEHTRVFIISDEIVASHYLDKVAAQLQSSAAHLSTITIPVGEPSKCVKQLDLIWNQLLDNDCDRSSMIVALGGGVVGDLAGFAAATFGRGINFVQIPTSLLAQVDSSVGGKTGINLPGAKNMVGSFWQPKFVLIDPLVLQTLDQANYRAGLAEVIKYGIIMDEEFFAMLESNINAILDRCPETLTRVIARCCELKAQVVREDELETSGRRAILNYGHTFGHAIENVFGYGKFLHGEAISIGMHAAARLAQKISMVDEAFVDRQGKLLQNFGLPISLNSADLDELVAAMHHDKKVSHGTLRLILPTKIGDVQLIDSPGDEWLREAYVVASS